MIFVSLKRKTAGGHSTLRELDQTGFGTAKISAQGNVFPAKSNLMPGSLRSELDESLAICFLSGVVSTSC